MKSRMPLLTVLIACGIALFFAATHFDAVYAGPLDPPAGPVASTTPSLADLEAKLDLIEANLTANAGPWQTWNLSATAATPNQGTAQEIVAGTVLVHQISVFRGYAVAFDGSGGQIDGNARVTSGSVVGHVKHQGNSANGQGQLTTTTLQLDVICENGLQLAYQKEFSDMHIQILYKVLPD